VVALVAIGLPVALLAGTHRAGATPDATAPVQYVVQPGDTMWTIAQRWHGARSITSYVDALVHANHGTSIDVGQLLTLPS
jgi:hypothetical protein